MKKTILTTAIVVVLCAIGSSCNNKTGADDNTDTATTTGATTGMTPEGTTTSGGTTTGGDTTRPDTVKR
jgi:hypothetical protein